MHILYFFAEHRNSFWNFLQTIGMNVGSETVLMVLLCVLFWCGGKRLAYRIGFTFFYSCLLIQGLKISFRIPRPWVQDPNFKALEEAIPSATGYSFPSGHSQTAASVFGTIFLHLKKAWGKVLMICLILLVGFSRMYAGVHTPLDVIVGIGATVVIAVGIECLFGKDAQKDGCLAVVLLIVAALLFLYDCVMLYGLQWIDLENAADLAKSAGAAVGFGAAFLLETKKIDFSRERPGLVQGILRVAVGLGGMLCIKAGLKIVLNPLEITGDFLRYFCMIFLVIGMYPYLFLTWEKKLNRRK